MYFLLNLALVAAACADSQPVKPPSTPGSAPVVPQDFVGFGIESAFLPNYDNDFSGNLVSSLAGRMGKPPVMRVGGTSGDYFMYDPQQKEARTCRQGPCDSSTGKFTVGPSFFKSYERFTTAKTTIQAPLENPVNISNTLDFVASAWRHLDNGKRVAAIALGNEVEYIYKGNNAGPYVTAALKLEDAIVKNLSLSGDAAKIFEAGNIASGSIVQNTAYHV